MTAHAITSPALALSFLTAGKAVVTLKSEKTGNHYTFKVKAAKKNGTGQASHFVHVRTGGTGKSAYAYMGYLRGGVEYRHGINKSPIDVSAPQARAFRYALTHILQKVMPPQCEIWHEGTCGRCNRPLSDPESIARGIGPECIKKMGG